MRFIPRSIRVLLRARRIRQLSIKRLSDNFYSSLLDVYRSYDATDDFTRRQANVYAEMCLLLTRCRAQERKIILLSIKFSLNVEEAKRQLDASRSRRIFGW